MQLYQACTIPTTQFVSLSILLKPSAVGATKTSITDPLVLASPTASISDDETISVIKDLHRHVSSILAASVASNSLAAEIVAQDAESLDSVASFRPAKANGIGLQYKLIRDQALVTILAPTILANGTEKALKAAISNIFGIILCVGSSGAAYGHGSSDNATKINDCIGIMARMKEIDASQASVLLSTVLLTDPDDLKTNRMASVHQLTTIPQSSDAEKAKNLMSPMGMIAPMGNAKKSGRRTSMADDVGNHTVEAPNGKNNEEPLLFHENPAEMSKKLVEQLNILSLVEPDTSLRSYEKSGQERKANLDLTGGKSRFRRRKENQRDPDLDGFDYKGPEKASRARRTALTSPPPSSGTANNSRRQSSAVIAPRAGDSSSRRQSTQPLQSPPVPPNRKSTTDLASLSKRNAVARSKRHVFDEETVNSNTQSIESQTKIQVNIALNEDLSCSYRLSELSSCSIEGVVQVQVKSTSNAPIPFYLVMNDGSGHIDTLQENKKFASRQPNPSRNDAEHRFAITIPPKAENYFPVLKYKCIPDLRPVPIRVQTKVRISNGECRVALQVSANPNNEAVMTDLNIIMGVPDEVRGETLRTQPAGGVWNESKRSVIWFVTELGGGERFQLQAKFMVAANVEEEPHFPVLVRCTCLFAQLSDIVIDVAEIPELKVADIQMKLARRFRLVHRERS